MAYEITEAKQLVVEAGKKLVENGLIARTWGNVSARISDTQFVITPSGRAYETLTPDDIVVVNIDDCSYEGDIKPSSEKGIHADAYKLRPNADFVIHTHQVYASVVGAADTPVTNIEEELKPLLGDIIPVASYGMPSTSALRKGVRTAYEENPSSNAVLMKHHGAVCTGKTYEEAFRVAEALEKVCQEAIEKAYKLYEGTAEFSYPGMLASYIKSQSSNRLPETVNDFGESVRLGDIFEITYKNGRTFTVNLKTGVANTEEKVPASAAVHAAIYKSSKVSYIKHLTNSAIVAVSMSGKPILPRLDDFAQIAGARIHSFTWDGSAACAKKAASALRNNNAVLVKGNGAIITGTKESDLEAVELVMNKECLTQAGSVIFGRGKTLSPVDCNIMRTIYVTKYSKKAG